MTIARMSMGISGLALMLANAAVAHEPPSGLLLHLPFDGSVSANGTATASPEVVSKGGQPAVTEPQFADGKIGQAIKLNGDSAVRIPFDISYAHYPQITFTAWVYPEGDASGYIFSARSRSGPSLAVSGSNVNARGPGAQPSQSGVLRPGRWTLVAGVWDTESGEMRLHYDRRMETMRLTDRVEPSAMDIWIGAYDDNLTSVVEDIRVDDVRIYGRALTPDEIEGLWLGQPPSIDSVTQPSRDSTAAIGGLGNLETGADAIEAARSQSATADDGDASQGDTGAQSQSDYNTNRQALDETQQAAGWYIDTSDRRLGGLAGSQGDTSRELLLSDGKGLRAVSWDVLTFTPCRLRVGSGSGIPVAAGTCNGTARTIRGTELPDAYITELVFESKATRDAIDSLGVVGYKINPDGSFGTKLTDHTADPDFDLILNLPDVSTCPASYVGTGLMGYFKRRNNGATAIVGLQLICGKVVPTND